MPVKRAKAATKKSSQSAKGTAPRQPVGGASRRTARPSVKPAVRSVTQARRKTASSPAAAKLPARDGVRNSVTTKRPKAAKPAAEQPKSLTGIVTAALEDMKAVNTAVLDVRELTDIADTMVVASGNSDRHVRSIADRVIEYAKKAGFRPVGVEGERDGEWVLVDLQDVIVHIMLPRVREFYRLEDLWDVSAAARQSAK